MKMIEAICPKCGAKLEIDPDYKRGICDHCGNVVLLDDEVQHVQYDNAEQAGYEFEKGRQRAQAEAKRAQTGAYTQPKPQQSVKKKNNNLWLWVLGWICIFPLPLTIILIRKKNLSPIIRYGGIFLAWVIFLVIGLSGNSKESKNSETVNKTPDVVVQKETTKETPQNTEESETVKEPEGEIKTDSYDSSYILSVGNHPCMFDDSGDILEKYPYLSEEKKSVPPAYSGGCLWLETNIKTKHIDGFRITLDKDYSVVDALDLAKSFYSNVSEYYDIEKEYGVQYKEDPENNGKEYRIEYKMKDSYKDTIGAEEIDRSPVYSGSMNIQLITKDGSPDVISEIRIRTDKSSQYFNLRVQGREEFEWKSDNDSGSSESTEISHIDPSTYSAIMTYFSIIDAETSADDISAYATENGLFSTSKEYTGGDLEVCIASDIKAAEIGRYREQGENILFSFNKDGQLKYAEYSTDFTTIDEENGNKVNKTILFYHSGRPQGYGNGLKEDNYYYFTDDAVKSTTDISEAFDTTFSKIGHPEG